MPHDKSFWDGKRVLITGVTGFAGSWLAEKLLEIAEDIKIFGLKRENSSLEKISHIKDRITLSNADMLDKTSLVGILKKLEPNIIFHLAAQASVVKGYEIPFGTFESNFVGTMNLVDSIRKSDINIEKMQFASSSNVYGKVKAEEIPIKETQELRPNEVYGVSKAAADHLCHSYATIYDIPIVVTRAFHHEGLRCSENVVGSQIAQQIAAIINGRLGLLKLGNIELVRDFSDVRDIVIGYLSSVENGKSAEAYNLCSGKGYKIKDLINNILTKFNIKNVKIEKDPLKIRSDEAPVIVGDNTKARKELSWDPSTKFEDTLTELINYYKSK
ncbi:MAG: GDP-mannose 4,6-dehydratase [Candidatus Aenigmarchaeota archaeon]|nr:GDP-mannose 4,6-dehydratase [Candidatus Aenigmarchaeota archaeon]